MSSSFLQFTITGIILNCYDFLPNYPNVTLFQDFSDVFRGSQAYAKPARPKSFDPNILLEEKTSPEAVLPSKSIVSHM